MLLGENMFLIFNWIYLLLVSVIPIILDIIGMSYSIPDIVMIVNIADVCDGDG